MAVPAHPCAHCISTSLYVNANTRKLKVRSPEGAKRSPGMHAFYAFITLQALNNIHILDFIPKIDSGN